MNNENYNLSVADQNIINIMKNYLKKSTYSHAIMLDGEWGSGKTYFVKNILIPMIKADTKIERTPVYVSLYGVKDTEELGSSLFLALIETRAENIGSKGASNFFSKIPIKKIVEILDNIKGDGVSDKKNIIESVISPWLNYDKHYFIFDDLERCPMPVNETLGFINQFVEQNNAKVLMIANENEIGTVDLPERELFKFLVASQSGIKWEEKQKTNNFDRYNVPQPSQPDIDEIKWRANKLIDEKEFYNHIKEKLVGRTIVYEPSLKDVIHSIFGRLCKEYLSNNCMSDCLKNTLIEKMCSLMNAENYKNLRTLQFVLDFYVLIYDAIYAATETLNSEIRKQVFVIVLESLLRVSIAYKTDGYKYPLQDNNSYDRILFRGDKDSEKDFIRMILSNNYFVTFKFVHDFVYSGSYDLENIQTVVKCYVDSINSENALTKLRVYGFEMEDYEIYENIKQLSKDLQNDGYVGEYFRVLSVLYNLKWAGVDIEINNYTKIMKAKIEKGHATINFHDRDELFADNPLKKDCHDDLDELKAVAKEANIKKKSQSLHAIWAKGSGWGEAFENHIKEFYQNNRYDFIHDLFKQTNLEKCVAALKTGTIRDLTFFQRIIGSLTDAPNKKDYFCKYIDEITYLIDSLDFNVEQIMEKLQLKFLKANLEDMLKEIGHELESD